MYNGYKLPIKNNLNRARIENQVLLMEVLAEIYSSMLWRFSGNDNVTSFIYWIYDEFDKYIYSDKYEFNKWLRSLNRWL